MRLFIAILIMPFLLSGCASTSKYAKAKNIIRYQTTHIKYTAKNLTSVSCKRLDQSMAHAYGLGFILKKQKPNAKQKSSSTVSKAILKAYYSTFQKEFRRRCKHKRPLITQKTKKVYPAIYKKIKKRNKQKKI